MKRLFPLCLSAILILGIIGCGKNKITDEEAIENLVRSSEWFKSADYQPTNASDSASNKSFNAKGDTLLKEPLWWRAIQDTGRHWDIDVKVTGDSAFVTWTLTSNGLFNILGQKVDSSLFFKQKVLNEVAKMYAIYKRTGNASNNTTKGWELKKISGVAGNSSITHTTMIDSIRIQSVTYPDTILKNPLGYLFDKENALNFAPLESVTVTIYANTSNAEAFLHVWPWPFRIPMQNNGDGTYTNAQKWSIQLISATRFAWFDLVHRNTIHDVDYSYDYDGWLYPYLNNNIK